MDKQQEIRELKSLKGDTYFNQFFAEEEIDQMCENISSDFAIECGIEKLEAVGKLQTKQQELDVTCKQLENYMDEVDRKTDEIESLARFMADQAHKWNATGLREKAIEIMGDGEYIKYILKKGYSLWDADKKMLMGML